jgi:hypothetical protein
MSRRFGAYLRQHHLVLILIFVALGGTAIAAGERGLQSDSINACVKKKRNTLSLAKNGKCPKKTKAISWNQEGPQGPQGPAGTNGTNGTNGAVGPRGPAGSAVGFGRVNADGTLGQSSGISNTERPQVGIYCITVNGALPSQRPMVVNTEYNGANQVQGVTSVVDQVDTLPGNSMNTATAQWDSDPNVCQDNEYEVRTVRVRVNSGTNEIDMQPADVSFSFAVV